MKRFVQQVFAFYFVVLIVFSGCQQSPTQVGQLPPTIENKPAEAAPIEPEESMPKADEDQLLSNLIAFSRLYGYIRYFHPSDQAAAENINWTRIAMNGIMTVRDASNSTELAQRLQSYFQPIAPTLQIFEANGEIPPLPADLQPPFWVLDLQVIMWEHQGVAGDWPKEREDGPYQSYRKLGSALWGKIPADFHDPRQPYYADLGGGVAAHIPMALFVDSQGTIPHLQAPAPENALSIDEETGYLSGVIIAWNVLQHFYPYFDVIDTNWEQVLATSLKAALDAQNVTDYEAILQAMLAELQDGHAQLSVNATDYYPPFTLDWIENRLVVVYVTGEASEQLQRGDVITSIDGRSAIEYFQDTMNQFSGTEQWRRLSALRHITSGNRGSTIQIEIEKANGERKELSLKRNENYLNYVKTNLESIAELEPGIFYVDLTRIDYETFQEALPELTTATGIIFDMRGYPGKLSAQIMLGHLIVEPVATQQLLLPIRIWPDQQQVEFIDHSWTITPETPYLTARKVFLINEEAISYAETLLSIVEYYHLSDWLVGEPTAGTNGDINVTNLPSNYSFTWTGLKVLRHDGTMFHGIGVQPTVPVSQSWQGVVDGRDDQLETALELLRP
jgi:C-terminal processing protease CtpA/Prc